MLAIEQYCIVKFDCLAAAHCYNGDGLPVMTERDAGPAALFITAGQARQGKRATESNLLNYFTRFVSGSQSCIDWKPSGRCDVHPKNSQARETQIQKPLENNEDESPLR